MSGESKSHKVISKVNKRLRFLRQKSKYFTPNLHLLLSNTLIQPYFDHACSTCYPNCSTKLKNNIQFSQNKCIRFCLQLGKISYLLKEDLINVNIPLFSNTFISNAPII